MRLCGLAHHPKGRFLSLLLVTSGAQNHRQAYSADYVEGEFSEVELRLYGVLRSWLPLDSRSVRRGPFAPTSSASSRSSVTSSSASGLAALCPLPSSSPLAWPAALCPLPASESRLPS